MDPTQFFFLFLGFAVFLATEIYIARKAVQTRDQNPRPKEEKKTPLKAEEKKLLASTTSEEETPLIE
jgi:hypothetical protein